MVAHGAGMDLHHHAVLEAICAISVSIWARNSSASAAFALPRTTLPKRASAFGWRQIGGARRSDGRGRWPSPPSREDGAADCDAPADSPSSSSPRLVISPNSASVVGELLVLGIDHGVGPVGGDHPALPAALADRVVMLERVVRPFGGGEHSMLKRSNRARGRNASDASFSPITSK